MCPWSDCWCKRWPITGRVVYSTGQEWTIEEVEPHVYRYVYLDVRSEGAYVPQ